MTYVLLLLTLTLTPYRHGHVTIVGNESYFVINIAEFPEPARTLCLTGDPKPIVLNQSGMFRTQWSHYAVMGWILFPLSRQSCEPGMKTAKYFPITSIMTAERAEDHTTIPVFVGEIEEEYPCQRKRRAVGAR